MLEVTHGIDFLVYSAISFLDPFKLGFLEGQLTSALPERSATEICWIPGSAARVCSTAVLQLEHVIPPICMKNTSQRSNGHSVRVYTPKDSIHSMTA